jgi:hypothetical protein
MLWFFLIGCVVSLEINKNLLPYGIENKNCKEESCIIRSLPPVSKAALQQFVIDNPTLWNAESIHSLDKTKLRGQLWLRLTDNMGTKQYDFPLWHQLKAIILPMLAPYVTQECQLLRVSFSFIDPARHPRYIIPHADTGRWAWLSHRIHHPLSGKPTIFYWHNPAVGNHSVEVHDLNRFEWNNIQTHSVTYLGDEIRVHLLSDIMDECPSIPLATYEIEHPHLCKYDRGDLSCRDQAEPEQEEVLADDEEFFVSRLTGRRQIRKKEL